MENAPESQFDSAVNDYLQDLVIPEFKPPSMDDGAAPDIEGELQKSAEGEGPDANKAKAALNQRSMLRKKLVDGFRKKTTDLQRHANQL